MAFRAAPGQRAVYRAVEWLLTTPAPRPTPFYCDPARVGEFAIEPDDLAAGTDAAVFQLLVTLSMYQALRDVVIMRQQRSMPRVSMRVVANVANVATVKRAIYVGRTATPSTAAGALESPAM